ncbi:hypothetical protein [Rhodopirellula bahusiensis]|uniref:hypothetical protein n=1 Tax=Rhodopirellula bahusiensis TaxID=2014065 RepID=UPI003265C5BB
MAASDEVQPSVFFRAFDIAFFVPGTLLSCSLLLFLRQQIAPGCEEYGNCQPAVELLDELLSPSKQSSAAAAILQIALFLVGSYLLGLICHAVCWPKIKWFHDEVAAQHKSSDAKRQTKWLPLKSALIGLPEPKPMSNDSDSSADETFGTSTFWTDNEGHYIKRIDYFWYLSGTCWNTGFALVVALLLTHATFEMSWFSRSILSVTVLYCSWALIRMGSRYNASFEKRKTVCRDLLTHRVSSANASSNDAT